VLICLNEIDYSKLNLKLDVDSRRRSSIDLTRGLMIHFENQLTPLFMAYIDNCFKVCYPFPFYSILDFKTR
jgi:hypothetical protein